MPSARFFFCSAITFSKASLPLLTMVTLAPALRKIKANNRWLSRPSSTRRMRPDNCWQNGRSDAVRRGWLTFVHVGSLQHAHAFQRSGADGEDKRASLALHAAEGDVAAQHAGQPFAQGQPKPHAHVLAACSGIALGEGFEKSIDLLFGHADAGIDDFAFQQGLFLDRFRQVALGCKYALLR